MGSSPFLKPEKNLVESKTDIMPFANAIVETKNLLSLVILKEVILQPADVNIIRFMLRMELAILLSIKNIPI
jgi:hypothetical protein